MMTQQESRLRWLRTILWTLVVLWMAAIVTLSSLKGQDLEPMLLPIPHFDKIAHAIAFAAGAIVLTAALRESTRLGWRAIFVYGVAGLALFGATDEWHQLYTENRSGGSLGDWIADTLGAAIGAFLTWSWYVRYRKTICG